MIGVEIIPISTLLTLVTGQIIETAFAAHDVLMEKETFRSLSSYLCGITPVLEELMKKDIKDSLATQQALEMLQRDVEKAKCLVNLCKEKSRFYQLIHCRSIVRSVQDITRDVGKSLALLSVANTEVLMEIGSNVDKLKDKMMYVEYQASHGKLEILEKIEIGIKEHRTDQVFLNELIKEIATAVGVPVENSPEMAMVLENFRKEIEEAAEKKEREEEAYMEQIIALLSRADVAQTPNAIKEEYRLLRDSVYSDEELPPFGTFCCPLSKDVMNDPVSVVTGQTYERTRIQEWFAAGNNTDPLTNQILPVLDLKPNHKLRECIEEWVSMNYCIRTSNIRKKLESGEAMSVNQALNEMQALLDCSNKIKYWFGEEQFIALLVNLLMSSDKSIKSNILSSIQKIVADSDDDKRQFVDAGGVEIIVRCLARSTGISKLAVALMVELLQADSLSLSDLRPLVLGKLSQGEQSILFLVALLHNREDMEASHNAEFILRQMCDKDQNVVAMAKGNWFTPLLQRLHHGSDDSKLQMARALGDLEPTEMSLEILGDEGAIEALSKLVLGSLEFKAVSLRALQNLSSCRANKKRLADAGVVPCILDHLFTSQMPVNVREFAAAILERLVFTDGTKFLVDADGNALDSEKIFSNLLALQGSSTYGSSVRKHALCCLQGLVSASHNADSRKAFKGTHGISILLPLIESREPEIRNAALHVLCCVANEHALEISSFLMRKQLAGQLVSLLDNDQQRDAAAAAAGILASLPQDDVFLTKELFERNAIPALMRMVSQGNATLKENAIGALMRFTLPSNIDLQKKLVDLGIFTALKGLIYSGTHVSKVRAAIAFQNFSISTKKLSNTVKLKQCYSFRRNRSFACRVHGGLCREKTTFCLVAAEVVPDLVLLVRNKESDLAAAAVDALLTLFHENENLENSAKLLDDEKAIGPVLDLLSYGTEQSKEKALLLMRKIFKVKSLANQHADKARAILVQLATQRSDLISIQATRVLASLENCEAS